MAGGGAASYLLPVVTILIHILFPPFLIVLGITILLASFGKSLGIRKLYVRALIRIFEFTRKIATEAREQHQVEEQISNNIREGRNGSFHTGSGSTSSSSDDEELDSVANRQNINSVQKLNEAGEKHGQVDSGVEVGNDSPTESTQFDQPLKTATDPPSSMESSVTNQSLNGEVTNIVKGHETEMAKQINGIKGEPLSDAGCNRGVNSNDSGGKSNDVAYMRQRLRGMGRESRHNVISRRDKLILSPDKAPGIQEIQKSVHELEELDEDQDVTTVTETSSNGKMHLLGRKLSASSFQREFELDDVYPYIKTGIASIIEDEVTQRFVAEELKSWNLLTRTSQSFEFVNIRLTIIWMIGFLFRYCVLLPGRILILGVGILWLSICMAFVGHLPDSNLKKTLHYHVYTSCFQILGGSLSAVITYHNTENKPKRGICVANHTSPIDVLILACDNAYALIGQMHGGVLGQVQSILSRCSDHIWFERTESKDRTLITNRLKEHVEDPDKLPILIFPEGTCINNTSVMQFKKGSFEVGGTIYPVAIKYDPLFGDAFWNSSKHGMLTYLYLMMTSWAIVCDVWYLPPMAIREDENAITFANRVKAEIATQGGLVDLMWDGNLKRSQVKSEWKGKQQQAFAERIKVD